jgi:fatty acid-binding protein DegV
MNRLEELAVTGIQGRSVKVAVHHLDAADRAQQLAKRLSDRTGIEVPVTEIGAVVGAHVGPGMVAVVVSPAPQPS